MKKVDDMTNEKIWFTLKELDIPNKIIAKFLAKKTGKSLRAWEVKLSNGVHLFGGDRAKKTQEEFAKYGGEFLREKIKVLKGVRDV